MLRNRSGKSGITVPHTLSAGDLVAVFSPSWAGPNLFPSRFERGLHKLRSLGFRTAESDHARANVDGKAGSVKQRAADFEALFCDSRVKAIIASIGGDDARSLIPLINWEAIAHHPKWFIGYSDTTALQCALLSMASMASLYGPTVMTDFAEYPDMPAESEASFLSSVCTRSFAPIRIPEMLLEDGARWSGSDDQGEARHPIKANAPLVNGHDAAHGRLVGGCIESLVELACDYGSRYFSAGAGDVLLLETSGRSLSPAKLTEQLDVLIGCIDYSALEGIVFGTKCWNSDDYAIVAQLLDKACSGAHVPTVVGLPIGHVTPCCSAALGVDCCLNLSSPYGPELLIDPRGGHL